MSAQPAYIHLTNGTMIDVRARDAAGVIDAIRRSRPVEIEAYHDGAYWLRIIPVTGIAYVEQALDPT